MHRHLPFFVLRYHSNNNIHNGNCLYLFKNETYDMDFLRSQPFCQKHMMPLQRQWDKRLIVRIIHQQPCFQRKSVAIGNPEQHVRKTSHRGSKQQWRSCVAISLTIACSRCIEMVLFFAHIPFLVISHIQRNTTGEVATQLKSIDECSKRMMENWPDFEEKRL